MSILILGKKSLNQRAVAIISRYGETADLRLSSVSGSTATSKSVVTIPMGATVQVNLGKTWAIQ